MSLQHEIILLAISATLLLAFGLHLNYLLKLGLVEYALELQKTKKLCIKEAFTQARTSFWFDLLVVIISTISIIAFVADIILHLLNNKP